MNEKLYFYTQQLVIDGRPPDTNVIDKIKNYISSNIHYLPTTEEAHTIEPRIIEDRFLCLIIKYGVKFPRTHTVFNLDATQEEQNPRQHHQIEQNKQVFIVYDMQYDIFYTSNRAYNKALKNFLKKQMSFSNVSIKNYFVNLEEFIKRIKRIKSLCFTIQNKRDLFSSNGEHIFDEIENVYGMDAKEIKVDVNISDNTKSMLDKFLIFAHLKKKDTNIFNVKSVGVDDDNVERIFNEEFLVDRVEISLPKNDDGLFPYNKVISEIISSIKNRNP